ncbi:uncharacterized protein TNCV_180271 [Trichonephila clavipes]|nr:uncharacterized protein TNCV_180271 [Trichonephila clavipes]
MWPCIVIHKNEVWANGTSEQKHMGKKYLITIAIPGYRPSVENVELSSPVQHNASPDKKSRTTVMVSFLGVTGIKPGPDLSPNQNALRITSGTEPTLIHKEDTTPLVDISVIPCSCRPRVATTNLSNSCTCGLARLPSARNDTFVDSQLCSYTGDSTPLLQLSDHSSTCEVVQSNSVHQANGGRGSPVVKVSDHGKHVMSSIPVPLKIRRVGQRCTLNLSRAEASSRWCGVVVRRGGASSGVVHVT